MYYILDETGRVISAVMTLDEAASVVKTLTQDGKTYYAKKVDKPAK